MNKQRAFTLIELLVVISIISLLASVVLASLNSARDKGRMAAGRQFDSNVYHAEADQAVGIWDFGECAGTTAGDRSGNGNSGALVGAPSWSTDVPVGTSCSLGFNGSSQYVDLGNTSAFDFDNSTSFTLSAWVKPASVSGYMRVIDNGHAGWTNGWLLQSSTIWGSNGVGAGIGAGGVAANGVYFQSNSPLVPGRWAQLTVVFDQSAKVAKLYIDGQQASISMYGGSCGTVVNGSSLNFAACGSISAIHSVNTNIGRYAGGNEYFNGSIDAVRIYTKALTAADVRDLYAAGAAAHRLADNVE